MIFSEMDCVPVFPVCVNVYAWSHLTELWYRYVCSAFVAPKYVSKRSEAILSAAAQRRSAAPAVARPVIDVVTSASPRAGEPPQSPPGDEPRSAPVPAVPIVHVSVPTPAQRIAAGAARMALTHCYQLTAWFEYHAQRSHRLSQLFAPFSPVPSRWRFPLGPEGNDACFWSTCGALKWSECSCRVNYSRDTG